MQKFIFLDRDGTINVDTGFTHKIEDFKFEKGAIEGLQIMQKLRKSYDYELIIATGQSGIGRSNYTEKQYHEFMKEMYKRLRSEGVSIDATYFCPHHPTEAIDEYRRDCDCRKPKIGMLEEAIKGKTGGCDKHEIFRESWVIGDKTDDIEMGRIAGCKTILVKTGKAGQDGHFDVSPDYTVENLFEAAHIIHPLLELRPKKIIPHYDI